MKKDCYLIWSNVHRGWWRPNAQGYTIDLAHAGHYTRDQAIKRSSVRDQIPGEPLPELPVRLDDILSVLDPAPASPVGRA